MLDDQKLQSMDTAFKRIFSFPITRNTFRQIQNTILTLTNGDKETSTLILESLFTGNIKPEAKKAIPSTHFKDLIDRYATHAGIAREVFERGEFISLVSSDILNHPTQLLFGNTIRRVDGQEFQFLTDIESTLHLLQHFLGRVEEAEKVNGSKHLTGTVQDELSAIKDKIEDILSCAKN